MFLVRILLSVKFLLLPALFAMSGELIAQPIRALIKVRHGNGDVRYQLRISGNFCDDGYDVSSVEEDGPCGHMMQVTQQETSGYLYALQAGDVITKIDGQKPLNQQQMSKLITAGAIECDGDLLLSVKDRDTKKEKEYRVRPLRVKDLPESPVKIPEEDRASGVRVILVAQTSDAGIEKAVRQSVKALKDLFEFSGEGQTHQLPFGESRALPELKEFVLLDGESVNSDKILSTIEEISVDPKEALVFIYLGHGAYDPNEATKDFESGGHFFAIGTEKTSDLPRRYVRSNLLYKRARLTVLISDSCNVRGTASEVMYPKRDIYHGDNWAIGNLFLDHAGIVDINSARKDQFGWCDERTGLWFTHSLTKVADPTKYGGAGFISWGSFIASLAVETDSYFQTQKILRIPTPNDELAQQRDFLPEVFSIDLYRTDINRAAAPAP